MMLSLSVHEREFLSELLNKKYQATDETAVMRLCMQILKKIDMKLIKPPKKPNDKND